MYRRKANDEGNLSSKRHPPSKNFGERPPKLSKEQTTLEDGEPKSKSAKMPKLKVEMGKVFTLEETQQRLKERLGMCSTTSDSDGSPLTSKRKIEKYLEPPKPKVTEPISGPAQVKSFMDEFLGRVAKATPPPPEVIPAARNTVRPKPIKQPRHSFSGATVTVKEQPMPILKKEGCQFCLMKREAAKPGEDPSLMFCNYCKEKGTSTMKREVCPFVRRISEPSPPKIVKYEESKVQLLAQQNQQVEQYAAQTNYPGYQAKSVQNQVQQSYTTQPMSATSTSSTISSSGSQKVYINPQNLQGNTNNNNQNAPLKINGVGTGDLTLKPKVSPPAQLKASSSVDIAKLCTQSPHVRNMNTTETQKPRNIPMFDLTVSEDKSKIHLQHAGYKQVGNKEVIYTKSSIYQQGHGSQALNLSGKPSQAHGANTQGAKTNGRGGLNLSTALKDSALNLSGQQHSMVQQLASQQPSKSMIHQLATQTPNRPMVLQMTPSQQQTTSNLRNQLENIINENVVKRQRITSPTPSRTQTVQQLLSASAVSSPEVRHVSTTSVTARQVANHLQAKVSPTQGSYATMVVPQLPKTAGISQVICFLNGFRFYRVDENIDMHVIVFKSNYL